MPVNCFISTAICRWIPAVKKFVTPIDKYTRFVIMCAKCMAAAPISFARHTHRMKKHDRFNCPLSKEPYLYIPQISRLNSTEGIIP